MLRARLACLNVVLVAAVVAGACYNKDDYVLTPGRVAQDLQVTLTVPTDSVLPADGVSRATISAQIDSTADSAFRAIDFTTTAGTLVGGSATGSTQEVPTNAHGIATIDLLSSNTPQVARIVVKVRSTAGLSQEIDVRFAPVGPDSIEQFASVPASAPADGATLSLISVRIDSALPPARRTVHFTTSIGTFLPTNTQTADITADATNVATVALKSPNTLAIGLIQATTDSVARDTTVTFVTAVPDTILVDPGVFELHSTQQTTVRAVLVRATGTATLGTLVAFTARDSTGASVGQLRSIQVTDATGTATAIYSPIGVTAHTTVTITASLPGTTKAGSATVAADP